nr:MAG TPA: hypothetical protein [Caudoviricetes sp.]
MDIAITTCCLRAAQRREEINVIFLLYSARLSIIVLERR